MAAFERDIAVDFVRKDENTVLEAEFADALQFVSPEDSAGGIVRVAQQE